MNREPVMNFLDEILPSTREAIAMAKRREPLEDLKRKIRDLEPSRGFQAALSPPEAGPIRLIAEIKQASPSQGLLRRDFRPGEIAKIYEEEKASALSVLTEERFFMGRLEHIGLVRAATKLPILRKDFVIQEYQIYQARAYEADAVLLIAALLDDVQLKDFGAIAKGLGMIGLVEVHDEAEVEKGLATGSKLIGINNRDLKTFMTDLETTFRLVKRIPDDRIVISESGIGSAQDITRLEEAGLDAVLIGETFMKSPDIRAKMRELFGVHG
jgi:indole-3-glycerol phosphate synthase